MTSPIRPPRIPIPLRPTHTLRFIRRLVRRVVVSPGAPPGTLVQVGPEPIHPVVVRILHYTESGIIREKEVEGGDAMVAAGASWVEHTPSGQDISPGETGVAWVDVEGVSHAEALNRFQESTGIHPLVMEDIMAVGQRPKLEEYDDYLFILLRMLRWDEEKGAVEEEQVSVLVGRGRLLTFRETPGDLFQVIRERIRGGKGRIRKGGADYLAYAVVDLVVDSCFEVLERLGERLEQAEEEILVNPVPELLQQIRFLKRELLLLRRSIWPLREMLGELERGELEMVDPATRPYLKDTYDHVVHVMDTVDALRDMTAGTLDLYVSTLGHRSNEVMKVLTVIASIFIPLTFIAGVYGMNFHFMPELARPWAYPAVLLLMAALGVGMYLFFRYRRWI
ncbi:MAG: magnesium/cobalt transporter CorA [Gemmatimonadota bacterium]